MNPRAMSEWITPAASWARVPRGIGHARTSSSPVVKNEISPSSAKQSRRTRWMAGSLSPSSCRKACCSDPADRRLRLETPPEVPEDRLLPRVGLGPALLDVRLETFESSLDHPEVGQQQLRLQVLDVAARVGGSTGGVGKGAHDVEERVGV